MRKKILVLNYEFPPLGGGASPVSYAIAKKYVELGYDVDVVTMGFKGLPRFEIKEGINIYRLPCGRRKKEISYLVEHLTFIVAAILFFAKHMRTSKYCINHTHFIIPTGIISLWVKKVYDLPYIVTSHGSDVIGYNSRFKKIYPVIKRGWLRIVANAKIVISPSHFLLNQINEITSKGHFGVIPNGVDVLEFKPLKKENIILVVARLLPNKGVQDILDALSNSVLKGVLIEKKWVVKIIGDGPYRTVLENIVAKKGLSKIVKFLGWRDNHDEEMKAAYGHAKIFISASYFENLSMVLLEALASECVVIAADVGGNPEIISKENLFRSKDANELRKKIFSAINGELAVGKLSKKFHLSTVGKEYVKVLFRE